MALVYITPAALWLSPCIYWRRIQRYKITVRETPINKEYLCAIYPFPEELLKTDFSDPTKDDEDESKFAWFVGGNQLDPFLNTNVSNMELLLINLETGEPVVDSANTKWYRVSLMLDVLPWLLKNLRIKDLYFDGCDEEEQWNDFMVKQEEANQFIINASGNWLYHVWPMNWSDLLQFFPNIQIKILEAIFQQIVFLDRNQNIMAYGQMAYAGNDAGYARQPAMQDRLFSKISTDICPKAKFALQPVGLYNKSLMNPPRDAKLRYIQDKTNYGCEKMQKR